MCCFNIFDSFRWDDFSTRRMYVSFFSDDSCIFGKKRSLKWIPLTSHIREISFNEKLFFTNSFYLKKTSLMWLVSDIHLSRWSLIISEVRGCVFHCFLKLITDIFQNVYQVPKQNTQFLIIGFVFYKLLTLFMISFLEAVHGWVVSKNGPLSKWYQTYHSIMKLGTVIPSQMNIQKNIWVTWHPLDFFCYNHFFTGYQQCLFYQETNI